MNCVMNLSASPTFHLLLCLPSQLGTARARRHQIEKQTNEKNPTVISRERRIFYFRLLVQNFSTSVSVFQEQLYHILYNLKDCKVRKASCVRPCPPPTCGIERAHDIEIQTFYWMPNKALKVLSYMSNLVIKTEGSLDICWFHT